MGYCHQTASRNAPLAGPGVTFSRAHISGMPQVTSVARDPLFKRLTHIRYASVSCLGWTEAWLCFARRARELKELKDQLRSNGER